jgi:hypothetical protein
MSSKKNKVTVLFGYSEGSKIATVWFYNLTRKQAHNKFDKLLRELREAEQGEKFDGEIYITLEIIASGPLDVEDDEGNKLTVTQLYIDAAAEEEQLDACIS